MEKTITVLFIDNILTGYEGKLEGYFAQTQPHWKLKFAGTMKEASSALSGEAPDAVVLDVALTPGGGEGLKLLTQLRRHMSNTPVIMLAESHDDEAVRDAFTSETMTDEMTVRELEPDGFIFADEIISSGRLELLEWKLVHGLYTYGRVVNKTGILITHGTDTMAWCLCYLRYALKNLRANVAVTGSQVPLESYFSSSDALGNLRTAVHLLNRLRPAHLFAVFNNGKRVFSGRLTKYRKWDMDAFEGRVAASAGAEGLLSLRKDWVFIPYPDQRLNDLHLIRTGGTIESQRDTEGGALKPTGDFVWRYVNGPLSSFFFNSHRHDLFALDSSNMSFEQWEIIAREVENIGVAKADTNFDLSVKPVYANPAFTTDDYRRQFRACGNGAVFAAFGGGNANILENSNRTVLPALTEAVEQGAFVAVTSQVPLESYDAEYDTGLSLLKAGGVPCGDLPLPDAQVKLSYLLGHEEEINRASAESGLDRMVLLTASFLAGVSMRKAVSLGNFERLMAERSQPIKILPDDVFVAKPFTAGLKVIVEVCSTCML